MTKIIYPVLPLRDIVIFPHMIAPLFVGRSKSINALESVMEGNKEIILITQKKSSIEDPIEKDLYKTGTIGNILQLLKLPDGTVKVLIEGKQRCLINKISSLTPFLEADINIINETHDLNENKDDLIKSLINAFDEYVKLNGKINADVINTISEIKDPSTLTDTVINHLFLSIEDKQDFLEILDPIVRVEKLVNKIELELRVLVSERKVRGRVKRQMEKTQREYYLNEQLKAIQKELGSNEDGKNEFDEIEDQINKVGLTKEAKEKANSELKKLKNMSPMSAEATVVRSYIDWLISIPWKEKIKVKSDIIKARKILDNDHYGLDKVKDRIIEFLAVQKRTKEIKGPILCLVGPPGVGKTSLGKSVARATGREFIRISLGGVRDESEIRGHRRTYIGSMPGKIIQSMKKAKTSNPLILLDEIDKMGQDFRGDPASAMLEVLDPEQNSTFTDHYLEVEYDLSNVLFLTTANSYNMPGPLLDRMETIALSGYTEEEKVEIACQHLLPKQIKGHGLKTKEFSLSSDTLMEIIRRYTREAGVRNLERELAKICRKAVTKIVKKEAENVNVGLEDLEDLLGVKRYRYGLAEQEDSIGVVTGLAWTSVGGDLLSIEALKLPGKGRMKTTGKLGDVMKESIDAASSFIRSVAPKMGIKPTLFEKMDIHVHVPEGATPKDGPSAGVGMVTSILSVLTGIAVKKDIAMTGEVTLRGNVLPIGGLKEKLLAALRGGITTVLIPAENEKDLKEIPSNVKEGLVIIPVSHVTEVLKHALVSTPIPIEWDAAAEEAKALAIMDNQTQASTIAH